MNQSKQYYKIWIPLSNIILIIVVIFSCKNNSVEETKELILVSINDSLTISKNEFIRRAEYTIRPPYCKRDTYVHKKIVLNSLIAEKLLALEAGQDNPLLKSEGFQRFIKGRKEQAMRQWMYHRQATEKVKLDSPEVEKYYKYAGREYKVAYYTIRDTVLLKQIIKRSKDSSGFFERFYQRVYGDTIIPKRKIVWQNLEPFKVLQSLFSDNIYKGKVLKPIMIDENSYLLIKVLGCIDDKVLTENQIKNRKRKVIERLKHEKANKLWENYVAQLMKGKKVDFNRSVFWRVCDIFSGIYIKNNEQLKKKLQTRMWNETDTINTNIEIDLEPLLDQPFFSTDNKIWTVNDFKIELMSHPLVFRKREISSEEFPLQFRLAVVDLIRDFYITKEAYKKGFDEVNSVKREENTWRDAYFALYQRDSYLESIGEFENFGKNYLNVINRYLNTYIDSLQYKYDKVIRLNIDEFEKIRLTDIDLYVHQPNLPYRQAVPRFPVLTTNHYLGYLAELSDH